MTQGVPQEDVELQRILGVVVNMPCACDLPKGRVSPSLHRATAPKGWLHIRLCLLLISIPHREEV